MPDAVSLVPKVQHEITTEGALDVIATLRTSGCCRKQGQGDIRKHLHRSDLEQLDAANSVGAQQVELCTAEYAELTLSARATMRRCREGGFGVGRIRKAAEHAHGLGHEVAGRPWPYLPKHRSARNDSEIVEFKSATNHFPFGIRRLNQSVREIIDAIRSA